MKAKNSKIQTLIKSTNVLTRMYAKECHTHFYRMLTDYFIDISEAREKGKLVVGHTMFVPVEILKAMDLIPMHLEGTGYMMSLFSGSCSDVISQASAIGMATEICSGHRMVTGAISLGEVPPVDFVVSSNLSCLSGR